MTNAQSLEVKITVIGVGGAGGNAINTMVKDRKASGDEAKSIFSQVQIIAANTDAQDLQGSAAETKIQLGPELTRGNGAGGKPDVGSSSAEESQVDISQALEGTEMLFVTAGMGGGTGTGAAPIIASVARKDNILTVGIVTLPFKFEGRKKMKVAQAGIEKLKENVDTLVIIPNEKLLEMSAKDLGIAEAFALSNEVLLDAVKNISLLITQNGLVNVDFEDVRTTMTGMGEAVIGFGSVAAGENASLTAVQEALSNHLLSDLSIDGADKALLYLGGATPVLSELAEAASYLEDMLSDDADFSWGTSEANNSDRVHALIVASAKSIAQKNKVIGVRNTNEKPVQAPLFASQEKAQQPNIDDIVRNLKTEDKSVVEEERIEVEDDILLKPAAKKEEPAHHSANIDEEEKRAVPTVRRNGNKRFF